MRIQPLLAALAVGLLAGAAAATVVLALDLPGLATRSAIIVEGRVLETRPELDRRGDVATRVVLFVARSFKGADGQGTLSFAVPGGELGDQGLIIAGVPTFTPGEELILFLSEESSRGIRMPTGLGQGKLVVERDPATGARRLVRSLAGMTLVDPQTGGPVSPAAEPLDYDGFVAALAAELAGGEAGR